MSDSENENYEPGRVIYGITREKSAWIATVDSYNQAGSYKVYFDEDGEQLEDKLEWWKTGNLYRLISGLLYIKDDEVVNCEDVDDDYVLEENEWVQLTYDMCP